MTSDDALRAQHALTNRLRVSVANADGRGAALPKHFYTGVDDKEHVLDWLEKAYRKRDTIMAHLKVDPLFDSLRSQERFQEQLRRMHFD